MVVTGAAGVAPIADINDDLQRETSFYERALASAEVAVSRLKALGWRRGARMTSTRRW
jgi:rRNA-processing protein EBP2